jgi:hypothetical protein
VAHHSTASETPPAARLPETAREPPSCRRRHARVKGSVAGTTGGAQTQRSGRHVDSPSPDALPDAGHARTDGGCSILPATGHDDGDDRDDGKIKRFATLPKPGPGHPEGIAADADGNIYVSTFDFTQPNNLYVFGRDGR